MLIENVVLAHSGPQPAEHIPHGDAKSPNAGLSPALTGLRCNPAYCGCAHFEPLPNTNMVPTRHGGGNES